MSINPREVPTGAVRYNTDSSKMEVYIGDTWMEVAVSSPNLDGGARGLAYRGGANNEIDVITIPTTGNATDFGNALSSAGGLHMAASRTRSIAAGGGTPSRINVIEFVTFSSTGNGQNFGDLTVVGAGGGQMGMSNQTRGVFGGRTTPGNSNTMDFITIASTGNSQEFGSLLFDQELSAAASSATRGVWMGGRYAPSPINDVAAERSPKSTASP